MYQTSSLTFIYKYLFVPILGSAFIIGIVLAQASNDVFLHQWSIGAAVMLCPFFIWMVLMAIRLQSAEVKSDKMIVKSLDSQKSIDYKDIEWLSQLAMINPKMISLKYYDHEIGESKKILLMPEREMSLAGLNSFKEVAMTKFIRAKIIEKKPYYDNNLEPSRWLPAVIIILTMIPAVFIFYFLLLTQ